jgi:probable poly-beta-1,6-N-acetyl-D-glucosamine export protein
VYLSPIHSFRGLAILIIVAGHCMWVFGWREMPWLRAALADLLANGTVLFMFISGYLFQHLSGKYHYPTYLAKKAKYVLIPYVIVSIPAIAYSVFWKNTVEDYPFLEGSSAAYQVLWFYLTGGTQMNYPLWFIPVILIYFLVSPVFYAFIRFPVLYWLILLFLPVALLAHRPHFPNPDTLHSLTYFLPAYLLGMFASQYREKVDGFMARNLWLLVGSLVSYFFLHLLLSDHHGNYHVDRMFSFEIGFIDWAFLQKILFAFVMLGLLNRYDSLVAGPLRLLGDTSFSIYFLHAYVVYAFRVVSRWHTYQGSLLKWVLLTVGTVVVCVAITKLVQRVFGRYSRMVIGS